MTIKNTTVLLDYDKVQELKRRGINLSQLCRDAIDNNLGSSDSIEAIRNQLKRHKDELDNYVQEKRLATMDLSEMLARKLRDKEIDDKVYGKVKDIMKAEAALGRNQFAMPDISILKTCAKDIGVSVHDFTEVYRDRKMLETLEKDVD